MERVVEVAIVILAPWPVARLLLAPPFHRRLAAHPTFLSICLLAVIGYAGLTGLLAFGPAWALRLAAVLALLASATAWWHARPSYGVARGLPPGSLTFTQLGMVQDDRFLLREAERHGPVFKTARYGHAITCVMGLRRGAELLRTAGDALASGPMPFSQLIPGGFIRYMAPADNARYRALLARALPNELVAASAPLVDAAARRAFLRLAAACGADGSGASPTPYLRDLTYEVMIGLFFGIAPHDPRAERMRRLYPVIEIPTLAHARAGQVRAAMAELTSIARVAGAEAIERSGAGAEPHCAVDWLAREAPDALTDPTMIGNLVYLVETGGRDVADLLNWCLKMLADNPEWGRRLRDAAHGDGAEELAERIVLETLRLEQSEYIVRKAQRPVAIGGYRIPKGWLVRVCVRESHRDAVTFPDPHRFDPDRFRGRRFGPTEYAPLGMGAHSCLGRTIVHVVASRSLMILARDFDWRQSADGPREFGAFHWMPSSCFKIAATPYATV